MRVALGQIALRVGDARGNARRIALASEEARRRGADLAVFPELALPGYPPRDLLLSRALREEVRAAEGELARASRGIAILAGSIGEAGPLLREGPPALENQAVLFEGGRVRARRAKRLLPSYDVFHEARWFAPGAGGPPVRVAGRALGLLVCEDLWDAPYPSHPPRELLLAGAEALVSISASPFRAGVVEARLAAARRHAAPLAYVNAVGGEDELVFDGGSFVLDARGEVVAALPRFEEGLAVVDLPLEGEARVEGPEARHRRRREALSREEEHRRAIVLGIRDFARKCGCPRAVLGLSGGIDSALAAALAAEALGPASVHGVAIPSRFNDPRSLEDARALAASLGIGLSVVPLEPLHAAALESLAPLLEGPGRASVEENAQARLRMTVLAAHVNARGGLLLSTSNKSELALGYGTAWGDLAGALAPLGDLWKSDVYALARRLEAERPGTFPPFTLARPPSAELRPGQQDPFDYAAIDPVLEALLAGKEPRGVAPAEVARLARLLRAAEWKRRQAPVVLKLSAHAIGSGRMAPIANGMAPPAAYPPRPEAAGARATDEPVATCGDPAARLAAPA